MKISQDTKDFVTGELIEFLVNAGCSPTDIQAELDKRKPAPQPEPYVPLGELEYIDLGESATACLDIVKNGCHKRVVESWGVYRDRKILLRRLHHEHKHGMKAIGWMEDYFNGNPFQCSVAQSRLEGIAILTDLDKGPSDA